MAEAPPSMQLPSGYDEDFVDEVEDDCLCLICHLPLKEPALTRCGHHNHLLTAKNLVIIPLFFYERTNV